MADISGYGLRVQVLASVTFPQGFVVSQFADDADPFDVPNLVIADKGMGLNGDLVKWSKAAPIVITLNIIAGTDDDKNLQLLFEANRPGRGKLPAQDVITLVVINADGTQNTYTSGGCMEFMPGNTIASSGRKKSKPYMFAMENKVGAPN